MAQTVRMRALISGSRNGKKWPKPGESIELPEAEAAQLIAQGIAEDPNTVETATADGEVETTAATGNKPLASIRDEVKAAVAKADADAKAKAEAEKAEAEKAAVAKADADAKAKAKTPAPKTKES